MDVTTILKQAIAAAKAGRKAEARRLLEAVLDADERNEQAWLWLGEVVESEEERLICLENVLVINPDNQTARQGLAFLRGTAAVPPPSSSERFTAAGGYPPAEALGAEPQDVVARLLQRIERAQEGTEASGSALPTGRRLADNRAFILITIILILILLCTVASIVAFVMLSPGRNYLPPSQVSSFPVYL